MQVACNNSISNRMTTTCNESTNRFIECLERPQKILPILRHIEKQVEMGHPQPKPGFAVFQVHLNSFFVKRQCPIDPFSPNVRGRPRITRGRRLTQNHGTHPEDLFSSGFDGGEGALGD